MPTPQGTLGRGLRSIWRFLRWPVWVLCIGLIALFAINAFDDALTDETRAMLKAPPNHLADEDNHYILVAGLDAPPGQSPLQVGQANLEQYERIVRSKPSVHDFSIDTGRTPVHQRLEVVDELKDWDPRSESFWDKTKARTAEVAHSVSRNAELMVRYESLHGTKGYHNTASISIHLPLYHPSQQLRTLYLADIARRAQSGDLARQQSAVQSLTADLDMYQRMLLGDGILIDKMLATAYLHSDLLLLADMLADPNAPVEVLAKRANRWLAPQSIAQWKIGKVFKSEFRFQAEALNNVQGDPSQFLKTGEELTMLDVLTGRIAYWFYLPNATLNLHSARMSQQTEFVNGDPGALFDGNKALVVEFANSAAIPWYTWGRNPMGKVLAALWAPAFREYPLRVYDIAALQRAVALAYQIRTSGISDDQIPALLAEHADWAAHPVSKAALPWDSKAREIKVPKLGEARADMRFGARVH